MCLLKIISGLKIALEPPLHARPGLHKGVAIAAKMESRQILSAENQQTHASSVNRVAHHIGQAGDVLRYA